MTGPEHYREAERLIADVHASWRALADGLDIDLDQVNRDLALAQVHATLALTAASVSTDRIEVIP